MTPASNPKVARFDSNNAQALGPKLETGKFHLIAGRMGAGGGTVKLELSSNSTKPAPPLISRSSRWRIHRA